MEVIYRSTRSNSEPVTASQAILKGLSDDGGLFVPDHIPALDKSLSELAGMSYQQVAYEVMKLFLTDFTEEELKNCINNAYDSKFDTEKIAPLVQADDAYYLELFHGSTIAFKDMALSILPHLMITSARKNNIKNEIVILTATSGDTGKAALAGFADVKGTRIIVFYPKNGVSPIQEKQMLTQKGANTHVVGIHGNFDQAQSAVKAMFNDKALAETMDAAGYQFSSANSINIGRLVPQIVYYVYAYSKLFAQGAVAKDEKINIVVPTGNFGNILAAFYAKNMGLPVAKLICASNANNVLTDFIKTGIYDRNRPFHTTISPSMDILISSNLERLLYHLSGSDDAQIREWFGSLSKTGRYEVTDEVKKAIADEFYAGCCDDEQTKACIKEIYDEYSYTCDTHTAVAVKVYKDYAAATGDKTKTVIASTASPYKFSGSVLAAIGKDTNADEFGLVDELAEVSKIPVPASLAALKDKEVRFTKVIDKADMKDYIYSALGI